MALISGEQASGGEVRDNDGRLIVVGPGGVGISGGGGGTSSTVALDAPTLAALETISVANLLNPHPVSIATALDISDRTARLLGHVTVDNFPATQAVSGSVNVGNFPATQPVSGTVTGNQGAPNTAANGWPAKVTDGTNTAQVLNAAPGSDTGQSALAVRVVSQLGAGSGGGGSAGTIDAPGDNKTPTLAQHVQAFLSCFDGTDWDRLRGDTVNGLDVDVTRVQGTVATTVGNFPATQAVSGTVSVGNFPATQPVSGTVTANAGTGPWPVTDNGGSLTVDSPQLPAALVSGRLDVNIGAAGSGLALPIIGSVPAQTTGSFTSASTAGTANVTASGVAAYGQANISIISPATITAGAITLQVSDDSGTTWYPAGSVRIDNGFAENVVPLNATVGNRMYLLSLDGFTNVRALLTTTIVGTGTVSVRISPAQQGVEPLVATIPPRTMCSFAAQHALVVAETFASLTPTRAFTASAASTTMTVTAGRTLRLTSMTLAVQNTTTAAVNISDVFLRAKASGTIATTDPVMWRTRLGNQAAVLNTSGNVVVAFPDGLDLPSGSVFGVSQSAVSTNGVLIVSLNGYEF